MSGTLCAHYNRTKLQGVILVYVYIAAIKHHDQKTSWGRKSLFGLCSQFIGESQDWKSNRAGT